MQLVLLRGVSLWSSLELLVELCDEDGSAHH